MTYAIVKPRNYSAVNPSTIPLPDAPNKKPDKGQSILISEQWWRYIEAINSVLGYKYARSVHMLWINGDYAADEPYSEAHAEAITMPGNFKFIDGIQGNFGHLKTFDRAEDPFESNDPAYVNWKTRPDLFFKCSQWTKSGMRNVANGLDVYLPNLRVTDRWINLDDVEFFPPLPMAVKVTTPDGLRVRASVWGDVLDKMSINTQFIVLEYFLLGAQVWGRHDDGWSCLDEGAGRFYTTWNLKTAGVVPPSQ